MGDSFSFAHPPSPDGRSQFDQSPDQSFGLNSFAPEFGDLTDPTNYYYYEQYRADLELPPIAENAPLQRQMTVGPSSDPLEQEADEVADRVMREDTRDTSSYYLPEIDTRSEQTVQRNLAAMDEHARETLGDVQAEADETDSLGSTASISLQRETEAEEAGFLEKAGNLLSGNGFKSDSAVSQQEAALKRYEIRVLEQKIKYALAQAPTQNQPEQSSPSISLRETHKAWFYEKAEKELQLAKLEGRGITTEDIEWGFVSVLLTHAGDRVRAAGEAAATRHNRVLKQFRLLSEKLVFKDNEARTAFIAAVAHELAQVYNYTNSNQEGLQYGVDGGPSRWNAITPIGNPDIDKGRVDCTQFVSMVLYAAGVTYTRYTAEDKQHNLKYVEEIYFGKRRPRISNNPYATNEKNISGRGATYDMDMSKINEEPLKRGATFTRANTSLFQQMPGPAPGFVGIIRDSAGNSTHGYVIISVNTNGTLTIAESAGGAGVRIQSDYQPRPREEYYQVRASFNESQLK